MLEICWSFQILERLAFEEVPERWSVFWRLCNRLQRLQCPEELSWQSGYRLAKMPARYDLDLLRARVSLLAEGGQNAECRVLQKRRAVWERNNLQQTDCERNI